MNSEVQAVMGVEEILLENAVQQGEIVISEIASGRAHPKERRPAAINISRFLGSCGLAPLDLAAKPQSADQGRSLERLEIAQPDARADGRGVLVCPHERVVASLDPAEEL